MKKLKAIMLCLSLLSLTACSFSGQPEGEKPERHKGEPRFSVTVDFGKEMKTYDNVIAVYPPNRSRIATLIRFDDDTQLEIVGGTVWWTKKIPR